MSFEDKLKYSLRDYLQRLDVDAVEVTDYDDDTESGGGCATCWYEYAVVRITYRNSEGLHKNYTYSGSFSELIRELT